MSRYNAQSSGSAASKAGQLIGEAFARAVVKHISDYISVNHAQNN